MKGVIVAGGSGTRLYPATLAVNKQLLPVYDKPLIYYPLSTLIAAGIDDILLVVRPEDQARFEQLLGDGRHLGIRIRFAVQAEPKGIAHALIVARPHLNGEGATVMLGDNIFLDPDLPAHLRAAAGKPGGHVVATWVRSPERYGVVTLDAQGRPLELVEKPDPAPSNWAVTGVYVYDSRASEVAANLTPSGRGELEITDLNAWYLDRGELTVHRLETPDSWIDAGTHDAMLAAASHIRALEREDGGKIGCVEEAAYRADRISADALRDLGARQAKSGYGAHLLKIAETAGDRVGTGAGNRADIGRNHAVSPSA
ncbi:glucose-1-phosphate thymidylyltransferase [Limimonas halophila]|uniref:glucose-1-phosphate thymidylyltransferase n=1 Tax=Limimonas halophila TaxID=1082479 RepID=A0A1G7NRB5_9PROT|nr:sugar phosphate nucleotidyltransferase [Limimonas halophila]SDF76625.1 glucose-1-phosphate thymidylyltransferase [Limimonas halophila]